ncbi:MAG: glucose 1-dehydrogenase [Gammaproteobacteria bacterium]|nr:glucose 1-dehydrogenase [Gammaproteobacteria bacterium]
MGRVAGKIALVTGAAQGLGLAISARLLEQGARVVMTDINADGVRASARTLGDQHPGQVVGLAHDVTDEPRWQAVVGETAEIFGGLHVLVNNAGIGFTGTVEQTRYEDWQRLHRVDLDSVFLGCKYAIPVMRASGGGSIINVSSIAGIIAGHNFAAYNSAKAAVRHLSKSVALGCARDGSNIRCNSIHPVFIDTPILDDIVGAADRDAALAKLARQVPLGRIGEPDDVAWAVVYLASEESKFITGAELKIDGGISAM